MKKISKYLLLILITFGSINGFVCNSKDQLKTDSLKSNTIQNVTKSSEVKSNTFNISAEDGKSISCIYYFDEKDSITSQPLVILIHQFNQSKEQWTASFIDSLLAQKYKVLAYDIRGHGKSAKVNYELTKLLSDPDEAPKDLRAVFKWLHGAQGIDTTRIAAIGTSIGGNLACLAKYNYGAKTCCAISNSKDGFFTFLGISEITMNAAYRKLTSAYFICGNKDGDHESGQKYLMENYIDSPKEIKVFDSGKHGIFLMEEHPEIYSLILNWLKKEL
jgi:predicted alpha/beta-fold hydrolase